MYKNLKRFFEQHFDNYFKDDFMRVIIVEIKIKSGELNVNQLLRSSNSGTFHEGEFYENASIISETVPTKSLEEAISLVIAGSDISFETNSDIRKWIKKQTGLKDGDLAVALASDFGSKA